MYVHVPLEAVCNFRKFSGKCLFYYFDFQRILFGAFG